MGRRIGPAGMAALAAAGCFAIVGCQGASTGPAKEAASSKPSPRGRIVRQMSPTHVHNTSCGHFYYNGNWYEMPGHLHGPACGHEFQDGMWVWIP